MGAGRAHGPMGPWAEPWVKKKIGAALGPGPGPRANFFLAQGSAHGPMGPWARRAPMISLLFLVFLYVVIFFPIFFIMMFNSY